jgi:hypothetical protein
VTATLPPRVCLRCKNPILRFEGATTVRGTTPAHQGQWGWTHLKCKPPSGGQDAPTLPPPSGRDWFRVECIPCDRRIARAQYPRHVNSQAHISTVARLNKARAEMRTPPSGGATGEPGAIYSYAVTEEQLAWHQAAYQKWLNGCREACEFTTERFQNFTRVLYKGRACFDLAPAQAGEARNA